MRSSTPSSRRSRVASPAWPPATPCRSSRPELASSPDSLYFQTIQILETQGPEEAEPFLNRFLEQEPGSERGAVLRARSLELRGDLSGAVESLREYARGTFQCGIARGNLGRLQVRLGQTEEAARTLLLALTQEPRQERTLHLYAGLLEEKHGLEHALSALLSLSRNAAVGLPAWVGAVLAGAKGREEAFARAVLQAAELSDTPFPPNAETLFQLMDALDDRTTLWNELRPYCDRDTVVAGDARYAPAPVQARAGQEARRRGSLKGGTAAHQCWHDRPAGMVVGETRCIKPEDWQAQEIAGALGRGLSLLLAESLAFGHGVVMETVFDCSPTSGVVYHRDLPAAQEVATLAGADAEFLLSLYLSRKGDGDFMLDCERYDGRGGYLGHLTEKGSEPGECVVRLAARLAEGREGGELPRWEPSRDVESLLARNTAAAFLLVEQGALDRRCLPNPGLSLDLLAEHAAETQNPLDLLSYWNACCAAASMGFPKAAEQKAILRELLARDGELQRFL